MRLIIATMAVACAAAQTSPQEGRFAVASVHAHEGPIPREGGRFDISGSRVHITIYSIGGLILYAYDLKPYQLVNMASLDHTFWDIEADVGDGRPRTKAEFRPMMRALLAERFQLKVHRESTETPVYALKVGNGGPKLKESASEDRRSFQRHFASARMITLTAKNATMDDFADFLRGNDGLDRPVVDRTGLTGKYDFELAYVPQNRSSGVDPHDADEIDIFGAVTRLGLRMDAIKAPVDSLAVDHYEKPGEN